MTQYKYKDIHTTQENHPAGKASVFILKASVTVEAALALPIFFLAVICLIYLLEITAIQTSIKAGTHSAAKTAAKEMYVMPILNSVKLQSDIVQAIGSDRLERSIVEGGSSGIHCLESYASPDTGEMHIVVRYRVKLPIPQFAVPAVPYKEKFVMKAWTGYQKEELGDDENETVYITDTGTVYHRDYQCTYLQLSIHLVPVSSLSSLRNDSGGKYYACARCTSGNLAGAVYITDTGDNYHTDIGCSGLKRTIYAVPLSEVGGKGACSRCGQ